MISLTIKTFEGSQRVHVPTLWGELSCKQLFSVITLAAEERINTLEIFSCITGISTDDLGSIKSAKVEAKLFKAMAFLNADPPEWDEVKPPKKLVIGNDVYKYPLRLGTETLGQKIRLAQIIQKSDDITKAIPEAVAIYMQPFFDKSKFKADRIPAAITRLDDANGLDIYGLGIFFLTVCAHSLKLGVQGLLTRTIARRHSSSQKLISNASNRSGN